MGDAWHTTQAAAAALATLSASGLAQPAPGTRSSSSCLQDGRQLLTGRHFSILGERLRQYDVQGAAADILKHRCYAGHVTSSAYALLNILLRAVADLM